MHTPERYSSIVASKFAAKLRQIPELAQTLQVFNSESPTSLFYIERTYSQYVRIIKDLVTLSPQDRQLIHQATELNDVRFPQSHTTHISTNDFLEALSEHRLQDLNQSAFAILDPESPIMDAALQDLATRMSEGSELVQQGEKVGDGKSAKADHAIWGHTKGLDPSAMIHFVLCHYACRYMWARYSTNADTAPAVAPKDNIIAAIGDLLRLRKAQGYPDSEVNRVWESPVDQGGFNWNKPEKQAAFNEVVNAFRHQL